MKEVTRQLAEYRRLGVSHMALEVSYSVYPAIIETIERLAREVNPPSRADEGGPGGAASPGRPPRT